jgi:hypothetical protein
VGTSTSFSSAPASGSLAPAWTAGVSINDERPPKRAVSPCLCARSALASGTQLLVPPRRHAVRAFSGTLSLSPSPLPAPPPPPLAALLRRPRFLWHSLSLSHPLPRRAVTPSALLVALSLSLSLTPSLAALLRRPRFFWHSFSSLRAVPPCSLRVAPSLFAPRCPAVLASCDTLGCFPSRRPAAPSWHFSALRPAPARRGVLLLNFR